MFLVELGHTASRVSLHRCYMLAGDLPACHWRPLPNEPGVQRLDALGEAKIALLLNRPYGDSNNRPVGHARTNAGSSVCNVSITRCL